METSNKEELRQEIAKILIKNKVTIQTIVIGAKTGGTSRAILVTER